jgi:hypothetical protein
LRNDFDTPTAMKELLHVITIGLTLRWPMKWVSCNSLWWWSRNELCYCDNITTTRSTGRRSDEGERVWLIRIRVEWSCVHSLSWFESHCVFKHHYHLSRSQRVCAVLAYALDSRKSCGQELLWERPSPIIPWLIMTANILVLIVQSYTRNDCCHNKWPVDWRWVERKHLQHLIYRVKGNSCGWSDRTADACVQMTNS